VATSVALSQQIIHWRVLTATNQAKREVDTMGAFDYVWNLDQSSRIDHLEEQVKKLEEQTQILYEWVQYFKQQTKVENDTTT